MENSQLIKFNFQKTNQSPASSIKPKPLNDYKDKPDLIGNGELVENKLSHDSNFKFSHLSSDKKFQSFMDYQYKPL